MKFENSFELCGHIKKEYGDKVMLSFSCGKDSLASWIFLESQGFEVFPVYFYYLIPDLEFVEESLIYYERKFNKRIQRFPHPTTIQTYGTGIYQHDFYSIKFDKAEYNIFWGHTDTMKFAKHDLGLTMNTPTAIGLSTANNPTRRIVLSRFGSFNEKELTFYPVFDMKERFLLKLIFSRGIKLPIDYKIWGRSFDGINARFLKGLNKHFPNDYKKIKEAYPLIEIELLKYEL